MIQKDKVKHVVISTILGIASAIFANIPMLHWLFWVSIGTFLAKEIYDVYKPNPTGFSELDLFADFLGFGFGAAIGAYIMQFI